MRWEPGRFFPRVSQEDGLEPRVTTVGSSGPKAGGLGSGATVPPPSSLTGSCVTLDQLLTFSGPEFLSLYNERTRPGQPFLSLLDCPSL